IVGVPLRANGILQARVREAQYSDVAARKRASALRALMFIHLKQDLPGAQIAWEKCPSRLAQSDFVPKRDATDDATSHGVAADVEGQLAAIRTDLDSFHDAEASALMTSGYQMTATQFEGRLPYVPGFGAPVARGTWRFLAVADAMKPRDVAGEAEHER